MSDAIAVGYEPSIADGSTTSEAVSNEKMLLRVHEIANGELRSLALAIDEGHYPLAIMRKLGEAGAFAAHLKINGGHFGSAIAAMREVSRSCGSTGFLTWCHDVFGLYLDQSDNKALAARMLQRHANGVSFGGTGLSNPMKTFAGIERMALQAVRTAGGYRVSGSLPWVSHIGRMQYCGVIAQVLDQFEAPSHEIMFVLRCDEPVELKPCPAFSGMEGTSTWGIRLDDVFIDDADLIADPAKPYIARIRAAFILLQLGMGLGVTDGAIESMLEVENTLGHVNQYLDNRPRELAAELNELSDRVADLAKTPFDGSVEYFVDVLDARAQASELSLRSTQSALLHQGARGYLRSASPQRRIREAHFVAIVTPAIKHLRSEIARHSAARFPVVAL